MATNIIHFVISEQQLLREMVFILKIVNKTLNYFYICKNTVCKIHYLP